MVYEMDSFKLLCTTQTDYEKIAEAELWFNLLILGDESSIIMHTAVSGVIVADTFLDPFHVISEMKGFLKRDPEFFQYLLRIIPIDRVVETDVNLMDNIVKQLLIEKKELVSTGKFAINIRKRSTHLSNNDIISVITQDIQNPVDLKNPDWYIWIEIIGNKTGISICKPSDIFHIKREQMALH